MKKEKERSKVEALFTLYITNFLKSNQIKSMEAMKMNLFVALLVVTIMAFSAINTVSAADAPAPSPTADAAAFVPTAIASLSALAFAFLF